MVSQRTIRDEQAISAIMRKVRSNNTAPEVVFRKALWARGIRYRLHASHLPGKPDVVISAKKVAVFIDGDFWHGNQWRRRQLTALDDQFANSRQPQREYWLRKIRRTMQRDSDATAALLVDGWTVLRFWESDIRKDVERCVQMTVDVAAGVIEAVTSPDSFVPAKTVAEFFAGIGLVRMGLERQGWTVTFANDIDTRKYQMYKTQYSDAEEHFLLGDIHTIPATCVPTVTLATASFPCNDLSLAGSRHGLEGKESSAFWGFIRILNDMGARRPPFVLIENVTGFLTSHDGADVKQALLALNHIGYSVDTFILDAARFVPQSRLRLFIVGVLRDSHGAVQERKRQKPLYCYESDVRPKALADFILAHPDIDWAIRDLPSQPRHGKTLEDILEDLSDDSPEWWSDARATYLFEQMSPRRRVTAERMIAGRQWSYGTVFRRVRANTSMAELRTDGLAGCLRTPRGGSGRQILFKAGFGTYRARLLTPRECARLMGADDYVIEGATLNQALFGFGDAVCAPALAWIAEYYLNPLVNESIRGQVLRLESYGAGRS